MLLKILKKGVIQLKKHPMLEVRIKEEALVKNKEQKNL